MNFQKWELFSGSPGIGIRVKNAMHLGKRLLASVFTVIVCLSLFNPPLKLSELNETLHKTIIVLELH